MFETLFKSDTDKKLLQVKRENKKAVKKMLKTSAKLKKTVKRNLTTS
jgi:hypothetical protein